jgi:elongation factor Tu
VKNMITGAAQMDGAILLVDGSQGPAAADARARAARAPGRRRHMVVFLNKIDVADPELSSWWSWRPPTCSRPRLHGVPMVRGSALRRGARREPQGRASTTADGSAPSRELVDAIDAHIPVPERDVDAPFLMPIENVHTDPGPRHGRHGRCRGVRARRGGRSRSSG